MNVEKIRVLKTLKFGETVFQEGKVLSKPFPPEILRELITNSGTLEPIGLENPTEEKAETLDPPKKETPKLEAVKPKAAKPKAARKPKKLVPRGK